jgi:hypothetical protein
MSERKLAEAPHWIDGPIFDVTVEHREIARPGGKSYYRMPLLTGTGVLHTTEGLSLEVAFDSLAFKHAAPHFICGEGKIIQCRPVGVQGAALVDPANREAFIQIENVAYTGGGHDGSAANTVRPWLFQDSTLKPLVALMAYCSLRYEIPLAAPRQPDVWPDDLKDCPLPWYGEQNARRRYVLKNNLWGKTPGWWMHLEVPFNKHHDCGRLRRQELLRLAQEVRDQP